MSEQNVLLSKYSENGLMFKYSNDSYNHVLKYKVKLKIAKYCLKYTSRDLR